MTINEIKKTSKPTAISPKGYVAICQFEGLRQKAYKCAGGVWTIGYGHTKGVKEGDKITYKQAGELLNEDLKAVYNELAKIERLSQGMYDALASFIFNVGIGNFNTSTLKKKVLDNPQDKTIGDEFKRWIYSKGKILNGLIKRRAWEAQRYYEKD